MKAFFFACAAIIGIAVAANLLLGNAGFSSQDRWASSSARVD